MSTALSRDMLWTLAKDLTMAKNTVRIPQQHLDEISRRPTASPKIHSRAQHILFGCATVFLLLALVCWLFRSAFAFGFLGFFVLLVMAACVLDFAQISRH